MTKRTPELNRENGFKGQIAKLKKENEELKKTLDELGLEEMKAETEAARSIRCLKRFMERLVAPMNKEQIKIKNPDLAVFIDQTLAAIDFAAEVA